MSYAKAMKHGRNVRKCRKQASMHFGFDTGSGHWPASRSNPEFRAAEDVRNWFKDRHSYYAEKGKPYVRECIQEAIKALRAARSST